MRHDIAQKESRDSCFYHNPSPSPSVNVGDLAMASDNMTWINIDLGERDHFPLELGKMCQHFFHDYRLPIPYQLLNYLLWQYSIQFNSIFISIS